jgi:hypothetical protein
VGTTVEGPALSNTATSVITQGTQGSYHTAATGFTKNINVDSTLQSLLPPGVKITELLGNDPVPLGDDNTPMCLSYHIKGGVLQQLQTKGKP